jgi:hypothetical protein
MLTSEEDILARANGGPEKGIEPHGVNLTRF